jgi:exonuclease V gamma subunit
MVNKEKPQTDIAPDCSLQIFGSPSLRREAETVVDNILANLKADPTLSQTDIAILVPNMDTYQQHLRSVFYEVGCGLHYNLSNINAGTESLFANALICALQTAVGSFTRPQIVRLWQNPCFAPTHADENTFEQWLGWIDCLNVFYCYDQSDKANYSAGESLHFTWKNALRRLRLGRLMGSPANDTSVNPQINPAPLGSSEELEAFCSTTEDLFEIFKEMQQPHTGEEWKILINKFIERFLEIPEDLQTEELPVKQNLAIPFIIKHFDLIFQRAISIDGSIDFSQFFRSSTYTLPLIIRQNDIHISYINITFDQSNDILNGSLRPIVSKTTEVFSPIHPGQFIPEFADCFVLFFTDR